MYIKDISYMVSNRHVILYNIHIEPTNCLFTDNIMDIAGDISFFGGGGGGISTLKIKVSHSKLTMFYYGNGHL